MLGGRNEMLKEQEIKGGSVKNVHPKRSIQMHRARK